MKKFIGKLAVLGGISLATLVSGCGKEEVPVEEKSPAPIVKKVKLPFDTYFERGIIENRRQEGFVYSPGNGYEDAARIFYKAGEDNAVIIGDSLRAYNDWKGNLFEIVDVVTTRPLVDVDGIYGITEKDLHRSKRKDTVVSYAITPPGTVLDLAKAIVIGEGDTSKFYFPVSRAQIDSAKEAYQDSVRKANPEAEVEFIGAGKNEGWGLFIKGQ